MASSTVGSQVNPTLGQAGDSVGVSDVGALARICAANPDIKFLVIYKQYRGIE